MDTYRAHQGAWMLPILPETKASTICSIMLHWLLIKFVCHSVSNCFFFPFLFCHLQHVLVFFMTLLHMCLSVLACAETFSAIAYSVFFFTELQAHINVNEYPDIFAFCDLNMNEQILSLMCSEAVVSGVVQQPGWSRFVMTFFLNYWIHLALC